jgi:hypothetical protein
MDQWHLREEGSRVEICTGDPAHRFGNVVRIGSQALSFRPGRMGAARGEAVRYHPFTVEDRRLLRLIVAAPALAAALKQIEEHHAMLNANVRRPEDHSHTLRVARQALAALEG